MDTRIVLRIDGRPNIINQILSKYHSNLNDSFEKAGLHLYFEAYEQGVLIIFHSLIDFQKFHAIFRDFRREEHQKLEKIPPELNLSTEILTQPLNLIFKFVNTPPNTNNEDLIKIIKNSYNSIDPHMIYERINSTEFQLHFKNLISFIQLLNLQIIFLSRFNQK